MQLNQHDENTTHAAAQDMAADIEKAIESRQDVADALESLRKTLEAGFDALDARINRLTGAGNTECPTCGGRDHEAR